MKQLPSLCLMGTVILGAAGASACEENLGIPGGSGGSATSSGGMTGSGGLAATGGAAGDSGGSTGDSGGSTGTGGSTDPGSGGSTGSGGASAAGCTEGSLLLCDDFEGTSIDTTLWSVQTNNQNVVELSTEFAARGSQSVHIHTANGFGYLKNTSAFPVPNNDYFGRMFVRMARYSTVDWAHWTLAEAAGTGDGSVIRVGGQYVTDQTKNRYGVGSDGGPTGDWTLHDTDPNGSPLEPAVGEWVCLEWEHKGSANETRLYIGGELHPSLSTTTSDHGGTAGTNYVLPTMSSLWFGFYQYQSDPEAFDLWIDGVAIDDERIGCDK